MLEEVLQFLEEDLGGGDVTTESVLPEDLEVKAEIVTRDSGIVAGLEECKALLDHLNLRSRTSLKDGDRVNEGEVLLCIEGSAKELLTAERTLLNLLMRMSGIATLTSALVQKVDRYGVEVAGTRKTTPGFRVFEKRAIVLGGGNPHRMGLYDGVLIKDNHLAVVGMKDAIARCKDAGHGEGVEIEVSSAEECVKACKFSADIVLLDNMSPEDVKETISTLVRKGLRNKVRIEVSGNINLENIEEYAKAAPDLISLGNLTTSSKWLDMGLRIKRV